LTREISREYRNSSAYVRMKCVIQNPQTASQVPLDFSTCRIDTGFDGGVLVPQWHRSDAEVAGVEPRITNLTLADGSRIPAYVCAVFLQSVDDITFAPPGRPMILVMCGNRRSPLLGMGALKYCTILFDGPNQRFTIRV